MKKVLIFIIRGHRLDGSNMDGECCYLLRLHFVRTPPVKLLS